jgi:hypothetical protein
MAKFKISFGNSAGELDHKIAETKADQESGLEFEPFLDALREMLETIPLYEGDTIRITVIED